MNNVVYKENTKLQELLDNPNAKKTMLTEWFTANKNSTEDRDLTYCDFPTRYTWNAKNLRWNKRTSNHKKIGRLYYVNPMEEERFYLRMLLMIVKGATSYDDIYKTFKDACTVAY